MKLLTAFGSGIVDGIVRASTFIMHYRLAESANDIYRGVWVNCPGRPGCI